MKMAGKGRGILISTFIFLLLIVMLFPTYSYAEKIIRIYSTVDKNQIGINQTLTMTVTIEAKNISKVLEPSLPDISPLKIIEKNSSASTEISFINGKTSRLKKYQYQYTIKPEKIGEFIIGPISVTYKGKQYKTEPIEITVSRENSSANNYITDEGIKIDPEQIKREIFIKNISNKHDVYVGEQIYLQYEIFSTHEIEHISLISMPELEGFYKVDIGNLTKLKYNTILINGKSFKHAILKKLVLFPLYNGKFTISPLQVKVTALIRSKEFPNFFALPYTMLISSSGLSIKVNSLPTYRGKDIFSGIVGSLDISTAQYSKIIYSGEPSKFYITLKSDGNLNNIKSFKFKQSLKSKIILSGIYNNKKLVNNACYFSKKFEYTVIPEEKGNLLINLKGITYFDITKKRFITRTINPLSFQVKDISSGNNSSNIESKNIISSDQQNGHKYKILIFLLIAFLIILITILLYLTIRVKKYHNESIQNNTEQKNEKDEILRNIRLLMAEAESKLINNDILEASSLLKKILIIAVGYKLDINTRRVTINDIIQSNLEQNLKYEVKDMLDTFNRYLYSQKKDYTAEDKEKLNTYMEKLNSLLKNLKINYSPTTYQF